MKINKNDIHYAYNTKGYMMYYKDCSIGGAGISNYVKGCRSNLKLFREQAEQDKQMIINGHGQQRYYDAILKIKGE